MELRVLEEVEVIMLLFSLFQYKKPQEVLTLERDLLRQLKTLEPTGQGDADCKTQ